MGEIFTQRIHKKSTGSFPGKESVDSYEQEHFVAPQVKREVKPTPKSIVIRDDDWKSLLTSITYLFHKKQLQKLELDVLNEKVRNVHASKKGAFIVDSYKESILKKGMIVLREAIKEKKGNELLERLGDVWSSFYKNILPMLLAIFYPIQEQGTHIRAVTLVGFRDMVLLKTKVADALDNGGKVSPEIKQMLLVLVSVHDSTPPNEYYLRLEQLASRVITPYLGSTGLFTNDTNTSANQKLANGSARERKLSVSRMLKEEVTRKFRRSGSLSSSSNSNNGNISNGNHGNQLEANNNKETNSFKKRFRIGDYSPAPSKSSVISDVSDLTKAVVDNEMLAYLEERNQRWKERDAMLGSESLLE